MFVGGEIGDEMTSAVVAQLLFLQAEDATKDTDRDHFMSAEEAKKWGIVDEIL